jgi:ribosome-associated protein
LIKLAGSRATAEGVIVIDARGTRSQIRNREEAVRRLIELIGRAAHRPRARIATKPTIASQRKRLEGKRVHSKTKQQRRPVKSGD